MIVYDALHCFKNQSYKVGLLKGYIIFSPSWRKSTRGKSLKARFPQRFRELYITHVKTTLSGIFDPPIGVWHHNLKPCISLAIQEDKGILVVACGKTLKRTLPNFPPVWINCIAWKQFALQSRRHFIWRQVWAEKLREKHFHSQTFSNGTCPCFEQWFKNLVLSQIDFNPLGMTVHSKVVFMGRGVTNGGHFMRGGMGVRKNPPKTNVTKETITIYISSIS